MEENKRLGIYMDHSGAQLIELTGNGITTNVNVIESDFTHEEKEFTLSKSENLMHNTEQTDQRVYYKKLGEVIRNFKQVLLFGPTTAKTELLNLLSENHLFEKIKIEVKDTDKMFEKQRQSFVKDHFKHLLK